LNASPDLPAAVHAANDLTEAGYDAKEDNYYAHQRPEMQVLVPLSACRVLEVGCGVGSFAAGLKARRDLHVTGIEAFPEAAAQAAGRIDRVIAAGIEAALPQLAEERFDCIVINDVLEHLVDPWEVLRQLRPLLQLEGVLVASIPNVRYLPVFKDYVLHGQWHYQLEGVLDRTHLRFFTRRSMQAMFDAAGYTVVSIQGIHAVQVSWKFRLLNALCKNALSDLPYLQFACVVRPA
jgi:2-polyprenyl-3-methyl-5-hydroxy-6-metoxy-1,4-benzoquinol methylase